MADLDLATRSISADNYRMPAMILADGMLGQMMEPVDFPRRSLRQDLPKSHGRPTAIGNKRQHNIINSLYMTPKTLEELDDRPLSSAMSRSQAERRQRAEEYLVR